MNDYEVWLTQAQAVMLGLCTAAGLIGVGIVIGHWIWGG